MRINWGSAECWDRNTDVWTIFYDIGHWNLIKISFPTHWGVGRPGGMPVPPLTSDMLATISMFENVKVEPMSFYSCPPPTLATTQITTQDQQNALLQQQTHPQQNNQQARNENTQQQHHSTVITANNDKDNMQGNVVS